MVRVTTCDVCSWLVTSKAACTWVVVGTVARLLPLLLFSRAPSPRRPSSASMYVAVGELAALPPPGSPRDPAAVWRAVVRCQARQIIDSRGNPTVEVDLFTELGMFRAAVPSGASTGVTRTPVNACAVSPTALFAAAAVGGDVVAPLARHPRAVVRVRYAAWCHSRHLKLCRACRHLRGARAPRQGPCGVPGKGRSACASLLLRAVRCPLVCGAVERGVRLQAVDNVNTIIAPALLGRDPADQKGIDTFMVQTLDGTRNEWGCVAALLSRVAVAVARLCRCAAVQLVQDAPWCQRYPRCLAGGVQGWCCGAG